MIAQNARPSRHEVDMLNTFTSLYPSVCWRHQSSRDRVPENAIFAPFCSFSMSATCLLWAPCRCLCEMIAQACKATNQRDVFVRRLKTLSSSTVQSCKWANDHSYTDANSVNFLTDVAEISIQKRIPAHTENTSNPSGSPTQRWLSHWALHEARRAQTKEKFPNAIAFLKLRGW